jgi:hypothetical protein
MGMGNSTLSMVMYMKDHTEMEDPQVSANTLGKMVQPIKVNFSKVIAMVKVH